MGGGPVSAQNRRPFTSHERPVLIKDESLNAGCAGHWPVLTTDHCEDAKRAHGD